jgi:hypothetical protein
VAARKDAGEALLYAVVTLEKTGDIRVEVAGSKWGRDIKTVDRGL